MSTSSNREKKIFFEAIVNAILEAGYTPPAIYYDEKNGVPFLCDKNSSDLQSIEGDSPIAILRDYVKFMDRLGY